MSPLRRRRRGLAWLAAGFLALAAALLLDRRFPPPGVAGLPMSVEVRDRHGALLRLFTTADGYWRLPVKPAAVDPRFLRLLLDYEDRRFHTHPGVDPLALLRALWQAARSGHVVSGGSTLTMQTVRLLHPRPRTLGSKLVEVLRALQLERRLDKGRILGLYLTLAPYGGNLQGLRAASLFYLGKEPSYLTLDEAALLVALPQAPEVRRPDRHPQQAHEARDAVLRRWLADGVIDAAAARAAAARPLPTGRQPAPMLAPHLADRLRGLRPGGGVLRTALDRGLQRALEALLRRHQGHQAPEVTLAAVVLDNADATVRAYAGSADYGATRFPGQVDMVRALRSPGSTLKPFIYGLGFDAGIIHPETLIFDRPGAVAGYAPGNFDHGYDGELRVRDALRLSRNIPAIKVLERVGPLRFVRRLARAGVRLRLPEGVQRPGLPVALGGVGIRLEDLAGLYGALAHDGRLRAPRLLLDAPPGPQRALLSPAAVWYLTDILRDSSLPEGFVQGDGRIALKTGTSYGFRDAWALGYDADHTVGVWVGRPDGGYTPGLSGLPTAVPVLQEVFGLLPSAGLGPLLRDRPAAVRLVDNPGLPPALRHFDPPPPLAASASAADGPHILYPPQGGLVELATGGDAVIRLETRGGQGPFHLLVDGRPVGGSESRRGLTWVPPADGTVRLTVLDARGRSDQVRFRVRRLGGGPAAGQGRGNGT